MVARYGTNSNVFCNINEILKNSIVLHKFYTEHQRFMLYQEKGLMIMPDEFEIGTTYVDAEINNEIHPIEKKIIAEYIPFK